MNNNQYNNMPNYQSNQQYNQNPPYNPQYNNQQRNYNKQPNQYNLNNNQANKNIVNRAYKKKNPIISYLLSFFIVGLGYLYIDKARDFLLVLIINMILVLTNTYVTDALSAILWIYTIFDVYSKTGLYNEGKEIPDL
ncbi:MAG: hypothetical protein LUG89_04650 [Methanosphaera sp.]|nr:hypothetical protein [Methanosphaera sp.]